MSKVDLLKEISCIARKYPNRIAIQSNEKKITYEQLEDYSNRLATYINRTYKENKNPIVVYGHKDPYVIICFLAAVKSGRAYCPVDVSVPLTRVKDIVDEVQPPIVLCVEELQIELENKINLGYIEDIVKNKFDDIEIDPIKYEDVFYIIFTSGSTGRPKGVQISYECLNNYLKWSITLGSTREEKEGKVFLNQAPFSFDLSVMDLYTSLAVGGTLWTLDKETQNDYGKLFESLKKSMISVWVSTPSFVEMCLIDENFNEEMLPNLNTFLFCGEVLNNKTVEKLQSKFTKAKIINTYGPTESTVAVTSVEVDPKLNKEVNPLPVGVVKEGSWLEIRKEDGSLAKEGEHGEINIIGDTVSVGYFNNSELTNKAFYTYEKNGKQYRAYKTGDEGYIKDNMLFYCGRIDLQVKLHGYRIELEDIENNILKLSEIRNAIVVPKMKDGKIKSLTAFVIHENEVNDRFKVSQEIKSKLAEFIPSYMIPKKFVFLEKFPVTNNGKTDRKQLGGMA